MEEDKTKNNPLSRYVNINSEFRKAEAGVIKIRYEMEYEYKSLFSTTFADSSTIKMYSYLNSWGSNIHHKNHQIAVI